MAIKTSRGSEHITITIDQENCNSCGLCVTVCKDFTLYIEDDKLKVTEKSLFGCIGCGQCVAVCPRDALMVEGRTLKSSDFKPLEKHPVSHDDLHNLLLNRRSVRDFSSKPVLEELIDKVLQTVSTAPMGIPPSEVSVLKLVGKEKVRQFSFDFIDVLKNMKFMTSPIALALMRPFMSKDDHQMMKDFVKPLVDFMIKSKNEDKNFLLYDAPVALYFHGNVADPADVYIAATYAMIAAESLGLGTCMIGSVGPFLKNTGKDFKHKYGLPNKMRDSIVVIMGYPLVKYKKTIDRTLKEVRSV
jgi:ferredoxin